MLDCDCCTLHVRVTNRAAFALYNDVLGYQIKSTDVKYYADGEDAYEMRLDFNPEKMGTASSKADAAKAKSSKVEGAAEEKAKKKKKNKKKK